MGRPKLHDAKTETALLAAAEALLAAEGLEAVSVRRLAEATMISPRAIYSLFGGMDGLMRALLGESFRVLAKRLDALPALNDPVEDLVAAGAEGFRHWALSRPQLFRLAFGTGAAIAPTDREAEQARAAFGRMLARVSRCEAEGRIAAGATPMAATAFHALCEGMASLELRGRFPLNPPIDGKTAWSSSLTALLAGFAPGH